MLLVQLACHFVLLLRQVPLVGGKSLSVVLVDEWLLIFLFGGALSILGRLPVWRQECELPVVEVYQRGSPLRD